MLPPGGRDEILHSWAVHDQEGLAHVDSVGALGDRVVVEGEAEDLLDEGELAAGNGSAGDGFDRAHHGLGVVAGQDAAGQEGVAEVVRILRAQLVELRRE